ncbi:MAG: hypothetical protein CMK89_17390 [Pseudomonadales bacterium]|nr:hypothetical protein [Pseudomonadales bacterium]
MKAPLQQILFPFPILVVLLVCSAMAQASGSWTNQTIDGKMVAVTPNFKLQVYQIDRPNESVWGKIIVPINADQLPELHKRRKSPNFPFIDVGVEVDKYYRTAQGHIHDDQNLVSVEIDRRHWDGLKKGNHLIIRLPDGTELKESLRGSGAALRAIERR